MSIAAATPSEAPIASQSSFEPAGSKTPPKRRTIATADPALVPEAR